MLNLRWTTLSPNTLGSSLNKYQTYRILLIVTSMLRLLQMHLLRTHLYGRCFPQDHCVQIKFLLLKNLRYA